MNSTMFKLSCAVMAGLTSWAAAEGPFKSLSFEQALEEAEGAKKLVFIDFYAVWCGPCKLLDRTTWKDEKVVAWLDKHSVALKIDAEKEVDLARRFKVEAYPTLVFIGADGAAKDTLVGYFPADEFLENANGILAGKTSLDRARERFEAGDRNDPMLRMEYAGALRMAGKNAEALEHLLWCFDEGAKRDETFAGVKNSFLLSDIARLGDSYPPALEALKKRQNNLRAKVNAGKAERSDVFDFIALNHALEGEDDSLDVYDKLRENQGDPKVIGWMREGLFDALLAAHRYQEIADSMDIGAKVDDLLAQRKDSERFYADLDAEQRGQLEAMDRQRMVMAISDYYQILAGLGKRDAAAKLAEKALSVDDGAGTYNALAWSGFLSGRPAEADLKMAQKADTLADGDSAAILDTLARIMASMNQRGKAVRMLEKRLDDFYGREALILKDCLAELKEGHVY